MKDYGDYDQSEGDPELDAGVAAIQRAGYQAGARTALEAILAAIEQGADQAKLRDLCEQALAAIEQEEQRESQL